MINFYIQLITRPIPWRIEVENPHKGTLNQVIRMAGNTMELFHSDYYFYHRQGKVLLDPDQPLDQLGILNNEGIVLIPKMSQDFPSAHLS